MNKHYWMKGIAVGLLIGLMLYFPIIPNENQGSLIDLIVIVITGGLAGAFLSPMIHFFQKKNWPYWLRGGTIADTTFFLYFLVSFPFGEGGRSGQGIFLLPVFLIFIFFAGSFVGLMYGKIKRRSQ